MAESFSSHPNGVRAIEDLIRKMPQQPYSDEDVRGFQQAQAIVMRLPVAKPAGKKLRRLPIGGKLPTCPTAQQTRNQNDGLKPVATFGNCSGRTSFQVPVVAAHIVGQ
jgi:hypothetical protein